MRGETHAEFGERDDAHRTRNTFADINSGKQGHPFATFLRPQTSVPMRPTTQTNSGGTTKESVSSQNLQGNLSIWRSIFGGNLEFGDTKALAECGLHCRSEVPRGSNGLSLAVPRINEVEQAQYLNDLATASSMSGISTGDFETMDSKIVRSLMKSQHGDSRKRVFNQEEKHTNAVKVVVWETNFMDDLRAFQNQRHLRSCGH